MKSNYLWSFFSSFFLIILAPSPGSRAFVSRATEGRHFQSNPLRESQSRLLISTLSWSECESATDKDRGQYGGFLTKTPV